jgi:chorismate synthase
MSTSARTTTRRSRTGFVLVTPTTRITKYGFRDTRGGGRSSARETVVRVAAGAIARKLLRDRAGVRIYGYLAQMGDIHLEFNDADAIDRNPFFCADPDRVPALETCIEQLRRDGDSIGARVTVVATGGLPASASRCSTSRRRPRARDDGH